MIIHPHCSALLSARHDKAPQGILRESWKGLSSENSCSSLRKEITRDSAASGQPGPEWPSKELWLFSMLCLGRARAHVRAHISNTLQIGIIFRVFSGEVSRVWHGKSLTESYTADPTYRSRPWNPGRSFPKPAW